ncbi:hypothetical protein [Victivallis vadensis]|uniref:hypothetical protein n=1 Tax=Victivallis vadensis TaxID=172901 RepID=UPI0023F8944E|nr:hypothetical protein [Victivallis vadensis]
MDPKERRRRWNAAMRAVGLAEPVREGVLTELGQGAALGAVSGLRGFASTLEELGGPAGPRKYFDSVLATNRQWNPDPDYTALSLNPANIARTVGTGAGQTATLLPAIAAGTAVGGPGGAALVGTAVFAQTYGDNLKDYRERFKDRYSENEIRAMSFGRTLVDSIIETGLGSVPLAGKSIRTLINGRAADAVARNAIKEASKKFGKATVVKALNNGFTRAVGKGMLGEGGEEVFQYMSDLITRSIAGDPSAVLNWGELAENAAAGAWAGAAFGAVDAGTGRMAQRDRRAAMPPIDVAEAVSPAWMKHYSVKDDSGAELAGLAASAPEGMSPADFTIVQPKSRAAKAVDAIGRELGLDIRYFVPMSENGAALNGVFARDSDAIYLDAAGTSRNPMQSLGHEFAHYLGKQAPDLADVWDQALNSAANPEARAAEETALREAYGELGDAGAEFSADRMGDMFTDPGMWSRAVQLAEAKQAGFGAKLLKVIDRFISAVKRQLVKFKSSEVEKFITDMDAAREAAAGVVAEFKRRQAGMLVPVEEHGQVRTGADEHGSAADGHALPEESTEAGTLPPFEASRELWRRQAEDVGRMAGMLEPTEEHGLARTGTEGTDEHGSGADGHRPPKEGTDGADNIYLRMPLERVRQDAAHGVKLAQEALKELEAQETAAEPEPAAEIPAITEDEFLASRGVGAPVSDYLLDKLRANKSLATERGRKRFLKEAAEAQKSHAEAREQVRKEYRELVDSEKIRNKTAIERSLTTAHGHPDLESTQAARRILAKKGIDWKTGEKITSEKPKPAPEIARLAGVGSTAEIVERLENGERLTVETKVKTDAGSAENISIYASRRPDGRFSIVTGRGNGADNLTAAQLRKKLDRMKFENQEETSARFEPAEKREADYKTWDDNGNWKLSKSSGEIAEDFTAALDAGKRLAVDTARGRYGIVKQDERYLVNSPAGKIYSYSRGGIGRFLVDRITSNNPKVKVTLAEEPVVPMKSAKKAEYSLSRKPESIQDFREMPAHPRPERAKFDNLRELYDIYKREYLGKTFTAASGHTITFKPGHFFRLIAGTPAGGRKGMVAKARNAAEAVRMIERGEIDFEDVAGYERKRAEYIHLFKDVITDADFYYNDSNDRIVFGKKYDGGKTGDGYLGVTLQISSNNLGILSFQPKNFTEALLKDKDIKWMVRENSASPIHSTGQLAEKTSGIGTVNITDSGEKSSGGAEYSLAKKPRQQVNPVLSNEDIRREYAEELGRNTYTPETVAEWDRKAVDWITRQGGVAGAVEAILHDTEHNDRHVASLVRRHVMNSDVFAKLDEDSRAKLETHHAFTGTEWGREGVARRLAALTLDSVAKVRALFDKLHADLPDKEKTELRNKVLDETGVDIFKLPKDIADNRRKLDAVLRSELAARSSRGDQLYEFWINSILSGPATHVRNVIGNTLNTAYELGPKRAVEAAINLAVRNPKGATFGEMREMWKHLDWKTAWERAVEAFDLEVLNPSGKYNDHAGVAIGGRKGRIIRIPGRLLRAADEFCKGLIAPVEAAAYAYREGRAQKLSGQELADFINARIKDGNSRASQWGELRARELAFQEEPGAAVRWLVSLKNSNTPAGKIAKIIFPFVQAPANLLRQGVRKSPLGVASLLAVDLPRAIRSREVTPEMMAHAAEQLIAWSAIVALWSAQDGGDDDRPLLTGSGAPYGSNERNFKANKFPPLSVRIGDRYYTYKFFEPLSSGLAVIANGLEAMRAKRPAEAKKALVGMSGFIAEKSYLASVKELFEFFQDPEHSGTRFATNFAASWIPNAYRQAVNAFDDKVRDNRTRARGLKYFTDQFDIVTNSAGFTRALPKLDYFGREVDKDAYADSPAGPLMRLLSVQSAAPDRSMDQADRLLWNYNRRNPESAYWPGLPSYYLKQGDRTLYIEGEDYAAFARDAGQLAHKAILSEIRSGSLNVKNPGEEDIKRIKLLFTKARKTAKEKYKGKFHE